MTYPTFKTQIPWLDKDQMREVDRLMVEEYRITLPQMMENAGGRLAELARSTFLGGNPAGKRVEVLTGTGGNGGGSLACARFLHNWGARIQVFTTRARDDFSAVPQIQLDILARMGIDIRPAKEIAAVEEPDLVIDGIIGYSLKGEPRGTAAELIEWANTQPAPVLSLDLPSGLDATEGSIYQKVVRAQATMTLALPKKGFLSAGARTLLGQLFLVDIGVPPDLYRKMGLSVGPLFARSAILKIPLPGAVDI